MSRGSLVALACLTLASASSCVSTTRRYVRDARIATSSQGDGNWVAKGSSVVVLMREFDPGSLFAVDAGRFEKLSIELPHARTGDRFRLGDAGVSILLTKGSSAWAPDDGYCAASAGSGEIEVVDHDERRGLLTVRLSLVLDCEWHLRTSRQVPAKRVRVDGEHDFREIGYGELTPWLGREGPTGYRGFAVTPNAGQ